MERYEGRTHILVILRCFYWCGYVEGRLEASNEKNSQVDFSDWGGWGVRKVANGSFSSMKRKFCSPYTQRFDTLQKIYKRTENTILWRKKVE